MINIKLKIEKKTISEVVISKLKDYIVDNGLRASDRLPMEQENGASHPSTWTGTARSLRKHQQAVL